MKNLISNSPSKILIRQGKICIWRTVFKSYFLKKKSSNFIFHTIFENFNAYCKRGKTIDSNFFFSAQTENWPFKISRLAIHNLLKRIGF